MVLLWPNRKVLQTAFLLSLEDSLCSTLRELARWRLLHCQKMKQLDYGLTRRSYYSKTQQ